MKLYMSVDIEGVAGISNWLEANNKEEAYKYFADQMTKEAAAAAEAAVERGASEIVVRDAHASARNMTPAMFPQECSFIRGWAGSPKTMMDGIDESFDGCFMIGYHSRAGSGENPLSHSFSSSRIFSITLNGRLVSEYYINMLTAAYYGVPLLVLSGDQGLCQVAKQDLPQVETVATQKGIGACTHSIHPDKALSLIKEAVDKALSGDLPKPFSLPKHFRIELVYKDHPECYKNSFYPGAQTDGSRCLIYEADDWWEILRFLHFVI